MHSSCSAVFPQHPTAHRGNALWKTCSTRILANVHCSILKRPSSSTEAPTTNMVKLVESLLPRHYLYTLSALKPMFMQIQCWVCEQTNERAWILPFSQLNEIYADSNNLVRKCCVTMWISAAINALGCKCRWSKVWVGRIVSIFFWKLVKVSSWLKLMF